MSIPKTKRRKDHIHDKELLFCVEALLGKESE